MKRILIVVGVLVAVVIAGLAIFIATFNVDRYRPLAIRTLQEQLGRPVDIQRLSMGWQGGLAVQCHGLVIYEDGAKTERLLELESAAAAVRLLPLLHKQVEVSFVRLLHPRVRIVRDAQGQVNLTGLAAAASPAGAPAAAPVDVKIALIEMRGGEVRWIDRAATPPMDIQVGQIDLTLRNVSLTAPIAFELRAAFFSPKQNVRLSGRMQPPVNGAPGAVDGFKAQLDLHTLDLKALAAVAPAVAQLGLQEIHGQLAVNVEHMALDSAKLGELEADVTFSGGMLRLAALAAPLESVEQECHASAGRIDLRRLSAKLAGGTINITGRVEHLNVQPATTLKADVAGISLQQLLPPAAADAPQLQGAFAMTFEGTAHGLAPADLSRTLAGFGRLKLTDAKVANLNILREVLNKLSVVPQLSQKLERHLSDAARKRLDDRDTVFKPIDLALTASDGAIIFRDLRVESDLFLLSGEGRLGLDGVLAVQTMLAIEPDVSASLISGVEELQALADAQGHLLLPVAVQGKLPRIAVIPDVAYVASQLLVSKTREWLGDLLEQALPAPEVSPTAPAAQ